MIWTVDPNSSGPTIGGGVEIGGVEVWRCGGKEVWSCVGEEAGI